MKKTLRFTLVFLFAVCALSVFAQAADTDIAKLEASTRRHFAGKKINITGGATLEFKRNMTGIKSGGAIGNLTLPFTWSVEGEFAVTKGSHLPGGPEETIYWKFTKGENLVAGKTKEQPTFTATASR